MKQENTKEIKNTQKNNRIGLLFLVMLLSVFCVCFVISQFRINDNSLLTIQLYANESTPLNGFASIKDGKGNELDNSYRLVVDNNTSSDQNGQILFDASDYKEKTFKLLDGNGKTLSIVKIKFIKTDKNYSELIINKDGTYSFYLAKNVSYVELAFIFDRKTNKLSINQNHLLTLNQQSGEICNIKGNAYTSEGIVLSYQNSIILSDATIVLPNGKMILPNGSIIDRKKQEMTWLDKTTIHQDGSVSIADKTVYPNGDVKDSKGNVFHKDGSISLSNGKVIQVGETYTTKEGTIVNAYRDESIIINDSSIRPFGKTGDNKVIINTETEKNNNLNKDSSSNNSSVDQNNNQINQNNKKDNNGKTDPKPNDQPKQNGQNISVLENGLSWTQYLTIHPFKDVVAPGSTGSYKFVIKNPNDFNMIYFLEISEYARSDTIPFVYRLKRDGEYVAGNSNSWESAKNLNDVPVDLPRHSSYTYVLEYKWPYERGSSNSEINKNDKYDTSLGENSNLVHLFKLTIYAEQQ